MSKERARRRAEREAEAARLAAVRQRTSERRARRHARRQRMLAALPLRNRATRRQAARPGIVAARRRRTLGLVALGFAVVQLLTWVSTPDWGVRAAVLVVSVLVVPVVTALSL